MTDGALSGAELRRTAYRAAAAAFSVFLFLFSPFSLLVIGWFADFEDAISHRVHEVSFGALFAVILVGAMSQLGRAERQVAGLLQMLAGTAALAIVVSASTGPEVTVLAYVIPPLALLALHPDLRSVLGAGVRPIRGMVGALAVVSVPMAFMAWDNFQKALDRVQGHESHWGAMAAFGVAIVLVTAVGALGLPGWRLSAASAGIAVAMYATVSLRFRFDASALNLSQAIVAFAWSTVVLAVAVRGDYTAGSLVRSRRERLVAGVAAALARHRGISPAWVRLGFVAVPIVGPTVYLALWAVVPAEPARGRARSGLSPLRIALAVGALAAILPFFGPSGVALALPVAVVAVVAVSAARVEGSLARRIGAFAATVLVALAVLFFVAVWASDQGIFVPVVPHQIESTDPGYCATCHVAGEARGAPIISVGSHPYGDPVLEPCVACHDHLPVAESPEPSAASWRLGSMRPALRAEAP